MSLNTGASPLGSEIVSSTVNGKPSGGIRPRPGAHRRSDGSGLWCRDGAVYAARSTTLGRNRAGGAGALSHVVDRVLNHSSGKISGVAKIYNRFEYLGERKAALEAWARHIESLIGPTPSNVVELPRRVRYDPGLARLGRRTESPEPARAAAPINLLQEKRQREVQYFPNLAFIRGGDLSASPRRETLDQRTASVARRIVGR
jgi:hypothetical protein